MPKQDTMDNHYNSHPDFNSIDRNIYKEYNNFRKYGPQSIFCYVPFNSMTFAIQGKVVACSYNQDIVLGYYPDNTIDEIWNGATAQKLREHMKHNDLDFGCQHCKYFFEKKKFSNLKPLVWDKYADKEIDNPMPRVLEFELSNKCNLECQMCSGDNSSLIRKNRDKLPPIKDSYDDAFVEQLEKYIPHLEEAKFYGGEPFLIDIHYKIWEKIAEINPDIEIFVITNGTAWNNRIKEVLSKGKFEIAISIDSTNKETLEKIRTNINYEKLMSNIEKYTEYCHRQGTTLTFSFTLQKDNWQDFPDCVTFCNDHKAFMFVSYLETPVKYAIPELPVDELIKISDYLDKFEFSGTEGWEQHNAQCFKDYQNFIKRYIKNKEEKRYTTYKYTDNIMLSPNFAIGESGIANSSDRSDFRTYHPPEITLMGNEEKVFYEDLNNYLNSSMKKVNFNHSLVHEKLKMVLSEFDEKEKQRIYFVMLQTPVEILVDNLTNMSVELMTVMAKSAIRQS